MAKDPAVLFYISDWLTSTAEMDADCRGWYLNLLLHNYDKGSLPGDTERLAVLAGVKFSEYSRFEQVLEQVLKQKFKQNSDGRLSNPRACTILKGRESFKEKRQRSGTIGYITKLFNKLDLGDTYDIELVKEYFYELSNEEIEELKNEQVLKQMLKQNSKLYRNENGNENESIDKGGVGEKEKKKRFSFKNEMVAYGFEPELVDDWLAIRKAKKAVNSERAFKNFITEVEKTTHDINEILKLIIFKQWRGFEAAWLEKEINQKKNADKRNIKVDTLEWFTKFAEEAFAEK